MLHVGPTVTNLFNHTPKQHMLKKSDTNDMVKNFAHAEWIANVAQHFWETEREWVRGWLGKRSTSWLDCQRFGVAASFFNPMSDLDALLAASCLASELEPFCQSLDDLVNATVAEEPRLNAQNRNVVPNGTSQIIQKWRSKNIPNRQRLEKCSSIKSGWCRLAQNAKWFAPYRPS